MEGTSADDSCSQLTLLKPCLSSFYGTRAFTDRQNSRKPNACQNCNTIPAIAVSLNGAVLIATVLFVLSQLQQKNTV